MKVYKETLFRFKGDDYTAEMLHLYLQKLSIAENSDDDECEDIIVEGHSSLEEPSSLKDVPIIISRIFGACNIIEIETDINIWDYEKLYDICLTFGPCTFRTGSNNLSFIVVYTNLSSVLKFIYNQHDVIELMRNTSMR